MSRVLVCAEPEIREEGSAFVAKLGGRPQIYFVRALKHWSEKAKWLLVYLNGPKGTKAKGCRFVAKGTRAVYASLEEETATREVTARKARLGGQAQISLKDYPRLMYVVSIGAKRCMDLRDSGDDAVLEEALAAALDLDDLAASQEVGDSLGGISQTPQIVTMTLAIWDAIRSDEFGRTCKR